MSAYELGFDLFKQNPDLTLVQVMWLGPKDIEALDFLEGYKAARRQHDDYQREKKGGAEAPPGPCNPPER